MPDNEEEYKSEEERLAAEHFNKLRVESAKDSYIPDQPEAYLRRYLHYPMLSTFIRGLIAQTKLSRPLLNEGNLIPMPYRYKESDSVEIKHSLINVKFSYESLSLNNSPAAVIERLSKIPGVAADLNNIRVLNEFMLTSEESDEVIDLKGLLPEGYFVVLKTDSRSVESWVEVKKRIVLTDEDLTSPRGIMSVLHELGHAVDYEQISDASEKDLYYNNRNITDEDLALFIKQERNAWAFALNKIRPFINKHNQSFWINRRTIQDFKNHCLSGHQDFVMVRRSIRDRADGPSR